MRGSSIGKNPTVRSILILKCRFSGKSILAWKRLNLDRTRWERSKTRPILSPKLWKAGLCFHTNSILVGPIIRSGMKKEYHVSVQGNNIKMSHADDDIVVIVRRIFRRMTTIEWFLFFIRGYKIESELVLQSSSIFPGFNFPLSCFI